MKSKTKFSLLALYTILLLGGMSLASQPVYAAEGLQVCGGKEATGADPQTGELRKDASGKPIVINVDTDSSYCHLSDAFLLVTRIINFLIAFAAIFAVVKVVLSGFQMILAAGNEKQIVDAKSGVKNALIGFVLVMVAFVLINSVFEILSSRFGVNYWFSIRPR